MTRATFYHAGCPVCMTDKEKTQDVEEVLEDEMASWEASPCD